MINRSKNILVFILVLLIAAAIYAWFYPLNKGSISINANVDDYLVMTDDKIIQCIQNPCSISFKTGSVNLKIQKDGYTTQSISSTVKRWSTSNIQIDILKNPSLEQIQEIPEEDVIYEKDMPEILNDYLITSYGWDEKGEDLAFLDQKDEKLKILDSENNVKAVTSLKKLSADFKILWSPDKKYILGIDNADLYIINISKASRKKNILGFSPLNIKWTADSAYALFNDDENDIYSVDLINQDIEPLAVTIDLNNSAWGKNDDLIYFIYDGETNKTDIGSFDLKIKENDIIITKYNFPVTRILSDKNSDIYFYNTENAKWYKLDY